jgi:hypothetical protein
MKATTLKRKYPDVWASVYDGTMQEMRMAAPTVAHNAAFYACSEMHKAASREVAVKTSHNKRKPK